MSKGIFKVQIPGKLGVLALVLLPLAACADMRPNQAACSTSISGAETIVFDENRTTVHASGHRVGTNILYWIDTKEDWRKFGLGEVLRDAGVKVARFPGGEVGDNYDWERNRLERPDDFPKEAVSEQELQQRLDFRSFLRLAKDAGVEDIYFVANLEGAFMRPGDKEQNVRQYARSAAQWVKAVSEAGYRVKYWEIGNESYLHSTFPLTAREYAAALRVFSKEMKAVDPDIKIGAIGPWSLDGVKSVAFADTLHPDVRDKYRANILRGEAPCKHREKVSCVKEINGRLKHKSEGWWAQLVKEAPGAFDFAVVHRYGFHAGGAKQKLTPQDDIATVKRFLDKELGRDVHFAITEWNVPGEAGSRLGADHAIEVAAQLVGYYRAGIGDTFYWPFRMKATEYFPLVNYGAGNRNAAFESLSLIAHSTNGKTARFPGAPLPRGIEMMTAGDRGEISLVAVNNTGKARNIDWSSVLGKDAAKVSVRQVKVHGGDVKKESMACNGVKLGKGFRIGLPAKSVVVVQVQQQGQGGVNARQR